MPKPTSSPITRATCTLLIGLIAVLVPMLAAAAAPEASLPQVVVSGGGTGRTIACGQTVSGQLEPTDPQLQDGTRFDSYELVLAERSVVTVVMTAAGFEPDVIARDGEEEAASGTPPLRFTLTSGSYSILAKNAVVIPAGTYGYDLSVLCEPPITYRLECGRTIAAALEREDPVGENDAPVDSYRLRIFHQGTISLQLTAEGFAPQLILLDPEGDTVRAGPPPLEVALTPAEYRLRVSSSLPLSAESHDYTLSLSCTGTDAEEIRCGETVNGSLNPGDFQLTDGTWAETYRLVLAEGATLGATVNSPFVPWVLFDDRDLETFTQDVPPIAASVEAGTYYITANSFQPLPPGDHPYALTVTCGAGGSCVGDCNGDGQVDVAEILLGVNAALGLAAVGDCPALDSDADGEIVVSEIIVAVNAALSGC
ncbi:MAG TPA: hypothetical protein VEB21_05260 [Terriglobales bacterium]|nr:hypothetical protein [Terriglobales bacterium]